MSRQNKKEIEKIDTIEKREAHSPVSVITKSTNPKVIISTETINDTFENKKETNQTKVYNSFSIQNICIIVLWIIIIITFFISIRSYITLTDISEKLGNIS